MRKFYLTVGFISFIFLGAVLGQNTAPVIDPISNQTMDELDTLVVPISSTDGEGDNITLSVENMPFFGVLTDSGNGKGSIKFIPGNYSGVYNSIKVVATDDGVPSLASNEYFRLTVNDVVGGPVIDPIGPQNMTEGSVLVVPISAVDLEGDAITLSMSNLPSFGLLTDNGDGTGYITFTPGFSDAGSYFSRRVIATDDGVPPSSSSEYFTLYVTNVDSTPVIHPIDQVSVNEGDTLVVPIFSSDPEGDAITLSLKANPSFGVLTDNGDGTGFITYTPGYSDAGTYWSREVIATDDGVPPSSSSEFFKLIVVNVNRAPAVDAVSDTSMYEGDTVEVAVNSTDTDGDNITLTASNVPSFGSFTDNGDGTGSFSFSPGFGDAGSYPDIQIKATDNGTPNLSDSTTFTLTVDANGAPVLSAIADTTMNEDDSIGIDVSSTDPDGDNITLTTSNVPSFGSFTDNGDGTGMFSFVTGFGDAGSYPGIQVIATDDGTPNLSDTTTFTLTVTDVNRTPSVDAVADTTMNEGDSIGVDVSSTDPDGDNITLTASNVPSFGSFTDNGDGTGMFSFVTGFGDAGSYPGIKIIATDDGTPGLSDSTTFTLTVGNVNRAPVVDAVADTTMNEGDSIGVDVSSTDPDGDNITLTASNVPSFGSFTDNGDGTGSFSFVTGFGDAGSYPGIKIIATDDGTPGLSDSTTFTLTVGDVNRAPVVDAVADTTMNEGDSIGVDVSSTDPDGDNITLTASNLPSFGSFTDNGDGTGMFSFVTGFGDAGSYPGIKVIATDDGTPNLSDTTTFTLTVGNVNRAPQLDPITDKNMNEGDTLDVAVNSTDPDADNITLTASNLPSFASFVDSGNGAGMFSFLPGPGDAGTYSDITVVATDDGTPSLTDTTRFTLTVGIEAISDPANLVASAPVADQVQLSWADSSDNEDGFIIEREDPDNPGYQAIDTVSAGTVAYTDTTVMQGKSYNYRVKGYNAFTESGYAGPTGVVTLLPAPSGLTGQVLGGPPSPWSIQLDWVDNSSDELLFVIERDSAGSGFVVIDTVSADVTTYTDNDIVAETVYDYTIYAITSDTMSAKSDTVSLFPTGVIDITSGLIPTEYKLEQNYPNPFNPSTTIRFALPFESNVKLEIFNVIGELVTVLINNEILNTGYKETEFNASNLPSGIYLYRIIATNTDGDGSKFVQTKKMILLK